MKETNKKTPSMVDTIKLNIFFGFRDRWHKALMPILARITANNVVEGHINKIATRMITEYFLNIFIKLE